MIHIIEEHKLVVYIFAAIILFLFIIAAFIIRRISWKSRTNQNRLKSLLEMKKEILKMIVKRHDIPFIFDHIISFIEAHGNGAIAAILLADEQRQRLFHAASSHLPDDFIREINGIPLSELSNPRFLEDRRFTDKYEFMKSCYFIPIRSSCGNIVLGVLCLFYNFKHELVFDDTELIEKASNLIVLTLENKKMEQQLLQKSEEKYELITENISDMVLLIDADTGLIEYVSPSIETILGIERDKIEHTMAIRLVHRGDRRRILKVRENVLSKQAAETSELRLIDHKGETVYMESRYVPILNDEKISVKLLIVSRNITERKKIEQALIESESKYRLITENMSDLITVTNMHGIVLYTSPSHKHLLGLPRNEEHTVKFIDYIHQDDLLLFIDSINTMNERGTPQEFVARLIHKQNHELYFEVHATPIVSEEGETQILWVARDITEKKKAEELLRKSDKLSVVGELAAGVAHEIKNPLTSLKGFVQLLEKEPAKVSNFLPVLKEELDQINEITDEFLALAQPQFSSYTEVKVEEMLKHAIASVKSDFDMNSVEVISFIDPALSSFFCSKEQMKRVLVNILTNSFEAISDEGTVTIRAMLTDNEELMISIEDNGCGMPSDRVQKLGEPYYSNAEKGTGIGLMLSYKIVQEHQGRIEIESIEGVGTKVRIVLPTNLLKQKDEPEMTAI